MTEEELREENERLKADLVEKDKLIALKNQDIVGTRQKYKKLADMTEDERMSLTETEVELKRRAEELEKKQSDFEKSQKEFAQKEITTRRENAIKKLVGSNAEIAEKVKANFARIKDAEGAQTEEEITRLATEAFNMLGDDRPKPIDSVIADQGLMASEGIMNSEATPAVKDLASKMGITI